MPYVLDPQKSAGLAELLSREQYSLRDVIVNINEDNLEVESPYTLFSEKSSSASGHINDKKGDTWLNNSLTFTAPHIKYGHDDSGQKNPSHILFTRNDSTFNVSLTEPEIIEHPIIELAKELNDEFERGKETEEMVSQPDDIPAFEENMWTKIPDKKGINLDNAIFLSSDRRFSFNTEKFKDFEYFRKMKQKIANNWYPPTLSNLRHYYIGGYTQSRLIASQEVYIYFTMNRQGDVLSVVLRDSKGNQYLDQSCIDAITNSRTFGPVPESIKGEKIVIPFIFGFYVR